MPVPGHKNHSMTGSANKTALVTGASVGIGAEFARQLAARSFDLVLVARRRDAMEELARQLSSEYPVKAHVIAMDLTTPQAGKDILRELERLNLSVDYLVNNAGYGVPGALTKSDWPTHERFIRIMVSVAVELCYHLLPAMQQRGWGRIINVASLAALVPSSGGHTLYGASKAFLVRFSESLYFENLDKGVRVQALCPGFTLSEFHDVTGTRDIVSKMPSYMWQSAAEVVSFSLARIEKRNYLPVAVSGRLNRMIARLMRWLPQRIAYNKIRKRAKHCRKE